MSDTNIFHRNGIQRKQIHYSPNLLSTVNNGIDNRKIATIEYDSHEKGITVRDVEPMAIIYKDGKRNLVGWCRLRNDYRSFRLDRLNCIKIRNEEFEPRTDFNLDNFRDEPQHYYAEHYERES